MPTKIDAEIDALFQLPLAEFTGERNALASRLKKSGRADDAARVKALAKPPATAWAVNQLYWQHRNDVEHLLALSGKLRKAHTGAAPDLRDLLEKRREIVSELTSRAAAILEAGGHAASADAMRRMSITLESLASWGRTEGVPEAGRLTTDLEPLGFDGLAALMGGAKLEPAKVLQFRVARERATHEKKSAEEQAIARAQAKESVKAAEKALTAARRGAESAEAALEKATGRADAIEKQKQEIEARYAEAKEAARNAAAEAKKAAQAVISAERALERARASLEN